MKRLLMVAYHFPPVHGSSGLQRTVSFARYLPQHGWQPLVLSAHSRAYERVSDDQLKDLAPDLVVRRAFALDTARHLSIGGRYPRPMALPDRWVSWCLGAIPAGLALLRRYRPQAIWSTYPIATAHLIGLVLSKLTGVPLIADFRDSMTEQEYPRDPRVWKTYRAIERRVVSGSARCVFTAGQALKMYAGRYPEVPSSRWRVIENGYDEAVFQDLPRPDPPASHPARPATIVHSGVIYPEERDPTRFFDAIAALKRGAEISAQVLRVRLRAAGSTDLFRRMLAERDIEDVVSLEPSVGYRDALTEMTQADGLLVLQARSCNHQIPAKLYEYLRCGRPILALTDADGDTAACLRAAGIDTIADLDDTQQIVSVLQRFLARHADGSLHGASPNSIESSSRAMRTREFAHLLDEMVGERGVSPPDAASA